LKFVSFPDNLVVFFVSFLYKASFKLAWSVSSHLERIVSPLTPAKCPSACCYVKKGHANEEQSQMGHIFLYPIARVRPPSEMHQELRVFGGERHGKNTSKAEFKTIAS
jgi:hypothetical protein